MFGKIEILTRAVATLNEEIDEAQLREDYSGRGMYGRTCPAIVTSIPLWQVNLVICQTVLEYLDSDTYMDMAELAQYFVLKNQDNMGKYDSVYY